MKKIKLTHGKVALVDDQDYAFLSQWRWAAILKRGGHYAGRWIWVNKKSRVVYMHRQIMGSPDLKIQIDHKDRNRLNNQKTNLRFCNNSQNQVNRAKAKGTSSQYRGVYLCDRLKNKWFTKIEVNKKQIFIGRFETEIEAAMAYNEKAKQFFGSFANLNKVA